MMAKPLTKERLRCFLNQVGGEIDGIKDDKGLLPPRVALVLLGGGKLVYDGLEQERYTRDIDFFSAYAIDIAFVDDKINLSPAATGASYPLSSGFNAELFNWIEPDLSSRKRSGVSIADDLESRYRRGELDVISEFQRVDICNMPDDLFVVNKVAAYGPERTKDLRDVKLVMERRYDNSEFREKTKESLKKFGFLRKYQDLAGKSYPL